MGIVSSAIYPLYSISPLWIFLAFFSLPDDCPAFYVLHRLLSNMNRSGRLEEAQEDRGGQGDLGLVCRWLDLVLIVP